MKMTLCESKINDAGMFEVNDIIGYTTSILSDSSLKTTDELKAIRLLDIAFDAEVNTNNMKCGKVHRYNYNQTLCEIEGLLSSKECQDILHTAKGNPNSFMAMGTKYDETVRNNERLLTIDHHLAKLLHQRLEPLINKHIIPNDNNSMENKSNDKIDTNLFGIPLGFDVIQHNHQQLNKDKVIRNDWRYDCINDCIRINRYQATRDGSNHFSFHRDTQYIQDINKRSLFTLVIYLNDDCFDNGETKFYIEKNKNEIFNINNHYNDNGFTMKNEMDYYINICKNKEKEKEKEKTNEMKNDKIENNNWEDNFIIHTIKPKQGNAVIFSHNIIHKACNVRLTDSNNYNSNTIEKITENKDSSNGSSTTNTTNKYYKYTMKTEIAMSRDPVIRNKYNQFAISNIESKDYINCIDYFRQAQGAELKNENQESNIFYELCLSLRYLYPVKLILDSQSKQKDKNKRYNMNRIHSIPSDLWHVIFDYVTSREVEIISLLFPNPLYQIVKIYNNLNRNMDKIDTNSLFGSDKLKYNFNGLKYEDKDDLLPLYIPRLLMQYGAFNVFEFTNIEFYNQYKKQCNFVIAMYTLFLFSNDVQSNYYVFNYNPFTQQVKCISLFELLSNVFYGKKCFGKYFKVQSSNNANNININTNNSDTIDQDPIDEFNKSIDREYMTLVHGL